MLRNYVEEEFYVALFSNDSLKSYPNNTLSAFTNLLSRPCRFDGDWHVGLVEIGFNDFTPESSRLIAKRSIETFSSDSSEYDTDEGSLNFNCCKPKRKQQKSYVPLRERKNAFFQKENFCNVKIDETYKFAIPETLLHKIAYNTAKKDVNFGKFLEHLSECITPQNKENENLIKHEIMRKILTFLDTKDWPKEQYQKFKKIKENYTLHVYMGSPVTSNVLLKYNTYNSVEKFVEDIIRQIPPDRRIKKKLKTLFMGFYPEYEFDEQDSTRLNGNNPETNENKILELTFKQFGINLKSNVTTLEKRSDGGVDLQNLVTDLLKNAEAFQDDKTHSIQITPGLLDKIKNSVLDEFRNRKADIGKALGGTVEGNLLKVDVLSSGGAPFSVKIPIKPYDTVKEFLNTIVNQLPPGRGDLNKFSEYVDSIFQAKTQVKQVQHTLIVPKELDTLLPENASDVNVQIKTKDVQVQHTLIVPKELDTLLPSNASDVNVKIVPNIVDSTVGMHLFSGNPISHHTKPNNKPAETINKDVELINPVSTHSAVSASSGKLSGYIFVYLDILWPRRIGSISSRVLKIIPNCGERCIRFQHVEYLHVEKSNFDSITALLTDPQGKRLNFGSSAVPTYLMLHFRKLEKYVKL